MAKPFKCSPLRKGQTLIGAISIKEAFPLTAGGFASEVEDGKKSCNDERMEGEAGLGLQDTGNICVQGGTPQR